MSTYPAPELLKLWKQEQLTVEQAIGHLLQHLAALTLENQELKRRVDLLEQRPPVER
ncbi:MAG: hypothetical protein U0350_21505 [Caldilineaceae bacterium]